MNSDSGMMNTDSGKAGKSVHDKTGMGVHIQPEWLFTMCRNMQKSNSKLGNADIDWCLYKYRHLVENVFARLKHYRAIATRYDKLARNYASTLALACCMMWLPM